MALLPLPSGLGEEKSDFSRDKFTDFWGLPINSVLKDALPNREGRLLLALLFKMFTFCRGGCSVCIDSQRLPTLIFYNLALGICFIACLTPKSARISSVPPKIESNLYPE